MIQLNELLTRRGLDAKRRKHEKETGLAYFYELYIIENEIMSEEFRGKTYITVSYSSILKKLKKNGNKPTYNKKQLKEKVSEHLDAGGYKWFYKFGKFVIVVKDDIIYDNKLRVTYRDYFLANISVIACSMVPLVVCLGKERDIVLRALGNFNIVGLFKIMVDSVGVLNACVCITCMLFIALSLMEMLVDYCKFILNMIIYKKYVKIMKGC